MATPMTLSDIHRLSQQVGQLLQSQGLLLTTAESCTGGGLSQAITHIAGSSNWFERGFITYSNAAKQELLGVPHTTLLQSGAVSQETALAMAKGALLHSHAQVSIAITGIAGPDGGSVEKPVGTVWVAYGIKNTHYSTKLLQLSGDREAVRQQAIYSALKGLFSMLTTTPPPVITLDGPSGTGKGTLCFLLAQRLGWHYLDSGASFRILALAALKKGIGLQDEIALQTLAQTLHFEFVEKDTDEMRVLLDNIDVTPEIRTEDCGSAASKIATLPAVRQVLLERQRAFRKWPGLVTDGRDMGTVIFPDAPLKIFLTANAAERAKRRVNQLKKKGVHATLEVILRDLEERDKRDRERGTAPLKPAPDAFIIDTTDLNIEASFNQLMQHVTSLSFV